MKKTLQISTYIFITMGLTSCVNKYRIQENEYKFIPYIGNESLVFESNERGIDTVNLKTYSGWSRTERVPYRVFHNKYEKYGIELIHKNPNTTDSIPDFMIELSAFDWKGLRVKLRTKSDSHNYVNKTSFTVSEFDSIPSVEMRINETVYSDVKVISGDSQKRKTENQVTEFYWSKKNGLVGWNCKNIEWRLREKYVPKEGM